ncbi:cob(I)yrinic acid a,c-diamide adenosyltransferase [Alicyclobacillus mengziensis]|uniref:Corrinoid adenosyltransferase n=1 Tax=Alicyclobacillus mengziensis TaxID=2931921 RepID=A0A9X7Z574_9BACL|nr:cob(I)yrinic acid a,c-diamide adenosyltransferase [Alicyclobacillus mengziensis]QSO46654.1 cob(I)yrinic acid a,c-diamide adenosyltransferase [Alicyclobacillus mengziensis]
MRMYTRGGDQGQTSIMGGIRRSKADIRVATYGSVDEAGAFLGLAAADLDPQRDEDIISLLSGVQQRLWDVGADLAAVRDDRYTWRTPEDAASELEPAIDKYQLEAPEVTKFILRGGSRCAAYLHVACTVVRRAEREAVTLMQTEEIHMPALRYLNRLSDLLFVLARAMNARCHVSDVLYQNSPDVFRR